MAKLKVLAWTNAANGTGQSPTESEEKPKESIVSALVVLICIPPIVLLWGAAISTGWNQFLSDLVGIKIDMYRGAGIHVLSKLFRTIGPSKSRNREWIIGSIAVPLIALVMFWLIKWIESRDLLGL